MLSTDTDAQDTTGSIDWQAELVKVAGLVDTTLFRSYMHALPSLAVSLFRLGNFCDPAVVEEKLYESGRYNDLIDFLHGKKLHREALELLEKFGRNEAAEEVMPALRGPTRTIGYLQQLPPEMVDIILEFAEWPIRADPNMGMDIFLADTENAENLPRDRVLAFLMPLDNVLAVKYLEHIINELNDSTPGHHQQLVDAYLAKLKTHKFANEKQHQDYRNHLEEFLRKSTYYNKLKTFNQLPVDGAIKSTPLTATMANTCLQTRTFSRHERSSCPPWATTSKPSQSTYFKSATTIKQKITATKSTSPRRRPHLQQLRLTKSHSSPLTPKTLPSRTSTPSS